MRRGDGPLRGIFDEGFLLESVAPWVVGRLGFAAFPRIDVSETDTEVRVVADIPGVDPEQIDIDVQDNRIIIRGRMDREVETQRDTRPYVYERMHGEFRREFTLPSRVKEDQAKATYKNGVLTIVLPKADADVRQKIKISRESS